MAWCEGEGVDYVLGLAKNERLKAEIQSERKQAEQQYQETGHAARFFQEFSYQTRESWSRARRVVAKAEHLEKGENPRFVVTSLPWEEWTAQTLYEELYCARGDMENRIKEQLMLFSDRTERARPTYGVISCGCTSPRWPTCYYRCCGDWDWKGRSWPKPSARRSG